MSETPIRAGEDTTGSALLASALWSSAGRLLPQLYTLAVSVAAARILGTEDFGRQSFIAFVELSAIMLATGGLPLALMQAVGETIGRERTETLRDLVAWAWGIEIAAAVLGGGTLLLVAALGGEPGGAWALAGLAASLGILHTVPSAVLIGAQRWRRATVVGLTTGAAGTAATIAVLVAGGGITGMFVVEALVSAANLVWTTGVARRTLRQLAPAARRLRSARRPVARFAALASIEIVLSFIVWRRSEFLFLEHYSTETQIAYYSIAFAVVTALVRVPEAFAAVLAPAVATLHGARATERIRSAFSRSLRLLVLMTLPLTAVSAALGPAALTLIYGSDYRPVGDVLLVLVMALPLVPLVNVSTAFLQGVGRIQRVLAAVALAAAVDVALAFVLVPRADAVGAAAANLVAQATAAVAIVVLAAGAVGAGRLGRQTWALLRAAAASSGAGAVAWLVADSLEGVFGVVAGAAAFTAAFVVLGRVLRILSDEDARWLDRALSGRLGAIVRFGARLFAPNAGVGAGAGR